MLRALGPIARRQIADIGCGTARLTALLCDILTGTSSLTMTTLSAPTTIIADKNYYGHLLEAELADAGITLLPPQRKGETPRPGRHLFKPLRQIIESVNDTLKGQLDLERHGGRTFSGVCARIVSRATAPM